MDTTDSSEVLTRGEPSVADDIVWGGVATPAACWRNFQTPTGYNDYELPNLMAPADYPITAVGFTGQATSAATPQVTGAAAIVGQVSPQLVGWPEGVRALLLATAVAQPIDAPRFQAVNVGGDRAAGVGILNAAAAASFARSQFYWTGVPEPTGYYRHYIDFSYFDPNTYDWPHPGSSTPIFTTGPISGG